MDLGRSWETEDTYELHFLHIILCTTVLNHCLNVYTPHEKVSLDSESFLIPGLPDQIEMQRSQLPENMKTKTEGPYWETMKRIKESEPRSYAVIHNTIYDLESSYAELYKEIKGKKPW